MSLIFGHKALSGCTVTIGSPIEEVASLKKRIKNLETNNKKLVSEIRDTKKRVRDLESVKVSKGNSASKLKLLRTNNRLMFNGLKDLLGRVEDLESGGKGRKPAIVEILAK